MSWLDIFDKYTYNNDYVKPFLWKNYTTIPTLGAVRGKIVLINQKNHGRPGIHGFTNINALDEWDGMCFYWEGDDILRGDDIEAYVDRLVGHMVQARPPAGDKLYLTYASATCEWVWLHMDYRHILAGQVNARLYHRSEPIITYITTYVTNDYTSYFQGAPQEMPGQQIFDGIVIMDYAPPDLISRIIES